MTLARLILVTGKGGTGKSAVAGALALSLARRRPTTLVDLDQRMWAARMLGIAANDGNEARSRNGADATPRLDPIANLETISLSAAPSLKRSSKG